MLWFTSYLPLNVMYEFPWFNKNNSSTNKDMKNLSTKMNNICLISLQTKLQPPLVNNEEKIHFVRVCMAEYETLVPII